MGPNTSMGLTWSNVSIIRLRCNTSMGLTWSRFRPTSDRKEKQYLKRKRDLFSELMTEKEICVGYWADK